MPENTDQTARDRAGEALHAVNNFRMVAEVKFEQIDKKIDATHAETNSKIDKIEAAIKWAGGLILTTILSVMAWAVSQQINANEAQKRDLAQQVELLKQQERARVEARSEILSRLPPSAAETAAATGSR